MANLPARRLILSKEAEPYSGFAEQKLGQLEQQRQVLNVPILKKAWIVNGITILVMASSIGHKIIMWGGLEVGQIMLATPGETTRLWVYDYIKGTLTEIPPIAELVVDPLHPFTNGECHVGESYSVTQTGGKYPQGALDPSLTPLGVNHEYALEILEGGGYLQQRVQGQEPLAVATLPIGAFEWNDDYASVQKNLLYYPRTHEGMWNLVNGQEWWVYNPVSRAFIASSWWVPNIFLAEGGNGVMVTGFYYGAFATEWKEPAGSSGGVGNPSSNIKVTFNALMQTAKQDARLPYGYCETLVSMDDTIFNEVFFYLSATPMPDFGNPSLLNQSATYHRDGGTFMHGKQWSFYITPTITLPEGRDYEVSFWNTADDRPELDFSAYSNDYNPVVISLDSSAELWLHTGAQRLLYKTERYHSHSFSTDGRIVAVFEQTGGVIDTVVVFDILNRATPNDNTSEYIPEVPLRTSNLVATASALSGCVIPSARATDDPASILPYTAEEVTSTETVDDLEQLKYVGSFGWVMYQYIVGFDGLAWRKIVIPDGIHAEAKVHDDQCMDGNFTWIYASVGPEDEISGEYTFTVEGVDYTGTWEAVLAELPYVLWSLPGWPYQAALCKWKIVDGKEVGEPVAVTVAGGDFSVAAAPLDVPVSLGGLVSSVTFDPPDLDPTCIAQEVEYVAGTDTYGCGGTINSYDTVTTEAAAPMVLTVSGLSSENAIVDGVTSASGTGGVNGVMSVTSPATISPGGGAISLNGACGAITIAYTSDCGVKTYIARAAGSGSWSAPSTTNYNPAMTGAGCTPYAIGYCNASTTKYTEAKQYITSWTESRTGGGFTCSSSCVAVALSPYDSVTCGVSSPDYPTSYTDATGKLQPSNQQYLCPLSNSIRTWVCP